MGEREARPAKGRGGSTSMYRQLRLDALHLSKVTGRGAYRIGGHSKLVCIQNRREMLYNWVSALLCAGGIGGL